MRLIPESELIGKKHGLLTILAVFREGNKRRVRCGCECGGVIECGLENVRSGNTESCGCLRASHPKHGESRTGKKSNEYTIWQNIKKRCFNPNARNYRFYGARGITMHPAWVHDFPAFLEHVGRRPSKSHSIDRIDYNGNYEPGNIRWATDSVQKRNTRGNRVVCAFGQSRCVAEWADDTGINYRTILSRLAHGMDPEAALSAPVRPTAPHNRRRR
jgi:hypothetical protein